VTLDEALAELGVDRETSADAARRAYLKLLKVRKPETDPQGFMRLREAWETVKGWAEGRDEVMRVIRAAAREPAEVAALETQDDKEIAPRRERLLTVIAAFKRR
jgi:hypothetical protein